MHYSLLEKALVYGPQLLSGLLAVLLLAASAIFKKHAETAARAAARLAAACAVLACAFIFIYSAKSGDIIHGVPFDRASGLILAASACFLALMITGEKQGTNGAVILAAVFAVSHAALFWRGPAAVFGSFIALDLLLFAALCFEKEGGAAAREIAAAKFLYIGACLVFAAIACASSGRLAKMAVSGMAVFMMLSSNAGLAALRAGGETESFSVRRAGLLLVSGMVPALILARFIVESGGGFAARPVVITAAALACLNLFGAITREKYAAFAERDSLSPFFLLPALACAADMPAASFAAAALLFMMSALLQNGFIELYDRGGNTVASVKYGFEKVKGAKYAFFGLIFGLAGEAWVFFLFYRHIKQDPLILAAIIFLAAAFSVAMLNKLFMIFSMIKRFKNGAGFDGGALRPALFAVFSAAMLAWWLK